MPNQPAPPHVILDDIQPDEFNPDYFNKMMKTRPRMKSSEILLFVYGTLKKDFPNSSLLRRATYVGDYITDDMYAFYDTGGFPVACPYNNEWGTAIKGELYQVSKTILNRVDVLEGHPDFFSRNIVGVNNGKEGRVAYMYLFPHPVMPGMRKLDQVYTR